MHNNKDMHVTDLVGTVQSSTQAGSSGTDRDEYSQAEQEDTSPNLKYIQQCADYIHSEMIIFANVLCKQKVRI